MAEIDKGLPSNTRTEIVLPTQEEIKKVEVEEETPEKGPIEVIPEEDGGATIDFEPGAINIPGTENHFDNLADIDAKGNVTTKSKGFDLRKGMSFADELGDLDLSQITREQADELLALGKKNIDLQALSKIKGVSFASQLNARVPLLQNLFDMARTIPDDLMKKNYLKAGGKLLG